MRITNGSLVKVQAAVSSLKYCRFCGNAHSEKRNKRRRPRRWVLPHITKHEEQGCYANLVRELRTSDVASFANFSRLYPELFDRILELVTPDIERRNTFFRNCISPGERLAITLRFMATGKYIHTVPPIFNFDTHQVQ